MERLKAILQTLERQGLHNVLVLSLERYKRDLTLGRVSTPLSPADASALGHLLGHTPKHLDLLAFDAALRQSRHAVGLLELLETLNGAPIVSNKQQRQNFEMAFTAQLQSLTHLAWRELLEGGQAGATRLKRALREGQTPDLEPVCAALVRLEQHSERLAALATQVAGHAHAFDADTLLGQLLLSALEALNLEPPVRDGVSSSVLLANLHGFACVHLPWREVVRLPMHRTDVWLLENPTVFEALLDAGFDRPLLCSSGQPSAACMALLTRLEGRIFVAADFDVGGLRIAKRFKTRFAARFVAWHFDTNAFAAALERGGGFALSVSLEPYRADFAALVAALEQAGRGAHQEAILERFLAEV